MSIYKKKFNEVTGAIRFLKDLYNTRSTFLFRGHANIDYRLQSSFHRHQLIIPETAGFDITDMVMKYRVGLVTINKHPEGELNNHDWLEMSRHYGLPSPCIDLTYSPYVALFFAFNGVRAPKSGDKEEYVVIYAVEMERLATGWTKYYCRGGLTEKWSDSIYNKFLRPSMPLFTDDYPSNTLQFIPYPSKHNLRMINQMGALLYDTIEYSMSEYEDLEDFIRNIKETDRKDDTRSIPNNTLIKVYINKKCTEDIFLELELTGITGSKLFMNEEGAAMDVVNTYNYNPKYMHLRDIEM